MLRKPIQRFVYALLVLWGVVTLVFILFRLLGDPARMVAGQSGDAKTIAQIRKELQLDQPLWKQYVLYLNDLSPIAVHSKTGIYRKQLKGWFVGGHWKAGIKWPYLGKSYQSKKDVLLLLRQVLPGTLVLALAAMFLATVLGIGWGMLAAVHRDTWIDRTSLVASMAGISAPSFFMAILIGYFFGLVWHSVTGLPLTGSLYAVNEMTGERLLQWKNLVLPALTLGIRPLAIITQLTRSSMLDVLSQDYIRTARAKGLSNGRILFRHALPNALNPVITAITGWFAELLAGSFFVEYIFGWNGMGRLTVNALDKLDYPVVMGSILVSAVLFVLVNLFSDMLYRWVDPRIR